MKKSPTFEEFKQKMMRDPEFKAEYERLQPEFDLYARLIEARIAAEKTQQDMAKFMRTKQPAIARLENGGFINASLATLQEYASALGYELVINFVPKKVHAEYDSSRS